ncbi:hypothetical protein C8A05DRAFT_45007 [Staphylotrichum tortipilum]|uniref:Uncharacterized protein n=1 Tax=Staphylotrichum tortipilum TaxID=2831512 RepID=A0AAN6MIL5_9PEZI|nr:hypothetical protein C8A05DRAFT_45007 [Staphylotrichum longicolle]
MADDFDLPFLSGNEATENGDLDSLFGDDDDFDLTSLFTGVGASESSPECERASSLSQEHSQQATNPAAQLSFPEPPSQTHSDGSHGLSFPLLHLPAVPDPPAASLSQQDGHTSGGLVVSTQNSAQSTPSPGSGMLSPHEIHDDAALEAELEALWESMASQEEQPVNAHAGSQDSDAAEHDTILPTKIPGFRYANTNTNSFIRLPRRIDLDPKLAEELSYYITLNRTVKLELLYTQLELSIGQGKRLKEEMKLQLREPPFRQFVTQTSSSVSHTKKTLVKIAFCLLTTQGWGSTWFGHESRTAGPRTLFWPADSSILLAGFVMLLYRMYYNQRQMHHTSVRQAAQNQHSEMANPVSRSPSAQPPTVATERQQLAPEGVAFFDALAKDAAAAKKRKRTETSNNGGYQTPYELEIPANARLEYAVYVKDKKDGSDLTMHSTYRHTDYAIASGAFASLSSTFKAAGQVPVFKIITPSGLKTIATEAEWESAVLAVYNMRRSGGVVEIEVYV